MKRMSTTIGRGQIWTPISPLRGSKLHAFLHFGSGDRLCSDASGRADHTPDRSLRRGNHQPCDGNDPSLGRGEFRSVGHVGNHQNRPAIKKPPLLPGGKGGGRQCVSRVGSGTPRGAEAWPLKGFGTGRSPLNSLGMTGAGYSARDRRQKRVRNQPEGEEPPSA